MGTKVGTEATILKQYFFLLQGSGSGDAGFSFDDFYVIDEGSQAPETSSWLLLGSGLMGALGVVRRKAMR